MKSCDTDAGGCGQLWPLQHFLEGDPPVAFTVQLAWETHCESGDVIRDTLAAVQEVPPSVPLISVWDTLAAVPLFSRYPFWNTLAAVQEVPLHLP